MRSQISGHELLHVDIADVAIVRRPVERIGLRANERVHGSEQARHCGLRVNTKTALLTKMGNIGGLFHAFLVAGEIVRCIGSLHHTTFGLGLVAVRDSSDGQYPGTPWLAYLYCVINI